jgi:Bardet-Biedl syndrome 2 protein
VPELISGWSNGKIDARNVRTGEVIFKDHLKHPVAGICVADYRLDGKPQLMCVSTTGKVKGYSTFVGKDASATPGLSVNLEQETIRELAQHKQQLLLELKNYKLSRTAQEQGKEAISDVAGVIPVSSRKRRARNSFETEGFGLPCTA